VCLVYSHTLSQSLKVSFIFSSSLTLFLLIHFLLFIFLTFSFLFQSLNSSPSLCLSQADYLNYLVKIVYCKFFSCLKKIVIQLINFKHTVSFKSLLIRRYTIRVLGGGVGNKWHHDTQRSDIQHNGRAL
jgi:hypothetical protein